MTTQALDASNTRLPYIEREHLANARVAVVGCGALGSGVSLLLAKSGVGHLVLVDPEALGWENIRRHRLGSDHVDHRKASSLARVIERENPDIGSVSAHDCTIQALLASNPLIFTDLDLVVACTGSWSADAAIDSHVALSKPFQTPVVYAWMEAHALASHAVLITSGGSFMSGFDEVGTPLLTASTSKKPSPAECGAATSPFGVVELSHAEALTARLALDFLRGKITENVWRTWLVDKATLEDAKGAWTLEWVRARGQPSLLGGNATGPWWS